MERPQVAGEQRLIGKRVEERLDAFKVGVVRALLAVPHAPAEELVEDRGQGGVESGGDDDGGGIPAFSHDLVVTAVRGGLVGAEVDLLTVHLDVPAVFLRTKERLWKMCHRETSQ